MTTLRDLWEKFETHYITCEEAPWKCGRCRWIEGELE